MISCQNGGHQALHFGADRKPVLKPGNCVGGRLCVLVCPEQAIVPGKARVSRQESAQNEPETIVSAVLTVSSGIL